MTRRTASARHLHTACAAAIVLLALSLALGACARRTPPHPTAETEAPSDAVPIVHTAPPTNSPLGVFLAERHASQHSQVETVFTPPTEGMTARHAMILSRERPRTELLRNVETAVTEADGIAAGLTDGTVLVIDASGSVNAALPENGPVGLLTWTPGSPALAATVRAGRTLHVLSLPRCMWVGEHRLAGPITMAAVSRHGSWAAAVDETHRLWLGPSAGTLTHAGTLRYRALALAFTPGERMLMAADSAGWVTLWSTESASEAGHFLVPGGPFASAHFNGRVLTLTPPEGPPTGFDIATRQPAPPTEIETPFRLENGTLCHLAPRRSWVKRVIFGTPRLSAALSAERATIRTRDIDGLTRHYSVRTGEQETMPRNAEWTDLPLTSDGRASIDDRTYALADPVMRSGNNLLLCRYIPGIGFYLWWEDCEPTPDVPTTAPASLPMRTRIGPDVTPGGVPLAEDDTPDTPDGNTHPKEPAP
ncbi:hypothetical protein GGQ74_002327 [Desulfobaculum xiamenense]|uniref:Uncharacterized protein n=1 Tax=Desulfobaculum xiamenense TaxID=995050 RepID=A0A846QU18_9BACT|nr:hypothetical protein [Desulfobaculum xiamenense]NJB68654.1 hypothetical protein [Desulfobaculum xiamenense]